MNILIASEPAIANASGTGGKTFSGKPRYSFLQCRVNLEASLTAVWVAFFIVAIGLMPSIVSLWILRRVDSRAQARLQVAIESVANQRASSLENDQHYSEELGYVIGDQSCQFNAGSPYIRCAVNPQGPCSDCRFYQQRL